MDKDTLSPGNDSTGKLNQGKVIVSFLLETNQKFAKAIQKGYVPCDGVSKENLYLATSFAILPYWATPSDIGLQKFDYCFPEASSQQLHLSYLCI